MQQPNMGLQKESVKMEEEQIMQDSLEELEQPVEKVEVNEEVQDNQVETKTEPEVKEPENADNSIEIEGIGKVKLDEVKEWKQGYLRQQDYTRKTQELARQRKEAQQAIELYNYLRANPHIAERLKEVDNDNIRRTADSFNPAMRKIEELEAKLAEDALEKEISDLKQRYPDFDEIKVLTQADKLGITDLEFVYKGLRDDVKKEEINMEDIKKQIADEIRKQIQEELKANADSTQTIITNNDMPPQKQINISPQEHNIAVNMGMSDEEYVEWRDK